MGREKVDSATILAVGPSGGGKSHTLTGQPDDPGISLRVLRALRGGLRGRGQDLVGGGRMLATLCRGGRLMVP